MNENNINIIKNNDMDLLDLLTVLWNDRKRIMGITIIVTLIGVLYALFATPLYKSTITMYPTGQESGGQLSQLQGMASTFGFDIGGGKPSFHIPHIVKSRRIKTNLIYHKWYSGKYNRPVNLIEYWDIDNSSKVNLNPMYWIKKILLDDTTENRLKWEEQSLELLEKRIKVNEDKDGLITIDILMEEPQMAADMVNSMYPAIVDFTIGSHAQQAKLNREFIENRQVEVKADLTNAENKLMIFSQENRSILESPQLQIEMERLMRDMEIKTQVYITLQQQYELASIEEVKETPSVVILDIGKPSADKNKPNRKLIVILALILGGITGMFLSSIRFSLNK